jgi:hypothetical protein
VLTIGFPLAAATTDRARTAIDHDEAAVIIDEWLEGTDLHLLEPVSVDDGSIHLELAGPRPPPPLEPLADRLAAGLGEDLTLNVDWVRERRFAVEGSR